MRVAVQKLDGVAGVDVSLDEGMAIIRFQAEARATVADVARAIRDNGFTPKEAQVRIRGRVVQRGGRLVLAVSGEPRPYPLHGGTMGAASTDKLRQALDAVVEIVGRVSGRIADGDASPPIEVVELAVRPAGGW